MAHNAKCFIVEAGWEKPRAARGELRRDTGRTGSQTDTCKMERDASTRCRRNLEWAKCDVIVINKDQEGRCCTFVPSVFNVFETLLISLLTKVARLRVNASESLTSQSCPTTVIVESNRHLTGQTHCTLGIHIFIASTHDFNSF